ncbi:PH domain-containing protein [Arthrobacter sp. VKM Ac-2550]|uniref:PH domain-containing protein n=1 Tax=Crystallibacter permensis TaxID=1938888 RepID=UPI002227F8D8|nr:PH domain-containing protein [Arthrobacter sp. VKM Ac-2550]MCW2131721.1 Short C-terminal domain-containing protein [Arthrobacter sp. VKM Ac-2550]
MAKIEKLIEQAQPHLQPGETIQAAVMGTYETKILGSDSVRTGVMLATDRRIVFFAKKLGGYDLESFAYGNISSFEQSKSMMGHQMSFFASGNKVNLKWISDLPAFEKFTQVFKSRIGQSAPGPAVQAPAPAQAANQADEVFDRLRKLGELRDAGIVTSEEFDAKKAELLARI